MAKTPLFSAEALSLQVGGWCLLEPRSPLLADQTAGAARIKSLAAGTFFLPQQEPEGFMFFNVIHQLGSCLPISRSETAPSPLVSPPHHLRLILAHTDPASNAAVRLPYPCTLTNQGNHCMPL